MREEDTEIEEYQHGDVFVRVYKYKNPPHNIFMLRIGGCCYLEVRERQLIELYEFLEEYVGEVYGKSKKRWWKRGR